MGFEPVESAFDRIFSPAWNPFYHLGALGFFYYWIVAISGIYVYLFFDTGTEAAYASVEFITNAQRYHAGIMRSLHRYASDGLVLMMAIHMVREFSLDRLRGARWFTWVTGLPVLWLVVASGITGYWLVWDKLAQYVAIATTEWLDWLPFFGEPIARNFLSVASLDSRFFTLLIFIHIAVPLILLFVLWIHLQRVSRPAIHPPRGLALGTLAMLVVLSLFKPATSHGPANLAEVPVVVQLDWFYLGFYPLQEIWGSGALWGLVGILSLTVAALPWMPSMRRPAPAKVDLENCNGCRRCVDDCPYFAVAMQPRSDGKPFDAEAVVNPDLCVSCGICAGACPTSTPFRRAQDLSPGIELPDDRLADLRARIETAVGAPNARRVITFACDHGANPKSVQHPSAAVVRVPCVGMVPPSFIDFVLSRGIGGGAVLAGCHEGECYHRFGAQWTADRLDRKRDPYLRARVDDRRVMRLGAGPRDHRHVETLIGTFVSELEALDAVAEKDAEMTAREAV